VAACQKDALDKLDDDGWSPLHYASWYGRDEIVLYLTQQGASVNIKNPNGSTPLHFAAGCGRAAVVKILIENGSEKNVKDKEKMAPIDFAKSYKEGDWEAIAKLLQ